MKVGKFLRTYLAASDVQEPMTLTITSGEREEVGQDKEPAIVLYFKEEDRGLILNKTALRFMVALTGSEDTDEWVGKQVVLYNEPNVYYQGKRTGGLRLREIENS